jgi:hypothetical protein
MKIVHENLILKSTWNKPKLEDCLKDWMENKAVQNFRRLQSILVNNLWWAHNSDTFRDKDIPLEITTGITLNLAKEFEMELKTKHPRNPSMFVLDYEIP